MIENFTTGDTLATIAFTVSSFAFGGVYVLTRANLKERQHRIEEVLRTQPSNAMAQLQALYEDARAQHSNSMGRIAGLEERLHEQTFAASAHRVENDRLKAENAALRDKAARIAAPNGTNAELRRRITELEGELAQVRGTGELINRQGENNVLRARIKELEASVHEALDYIPEWAKQQMERADKDAQRVLQLEALLVEANNKAHYALPRDDGARDARKRERDACSDIAWSVQREYADSKTDMGRAAADVAGMIARKIAARG